MSGLKVTRIGRGEELPLAGSVTGTVTGDDVDWESSALDAQIIVAEGDGTPTVSGVHKVVFDEADFTVTDDGGGQVTVASVGGPAGGFDPGWFIVTDYGATGDGITDDTAAIQDAIDACDAAGGGTVYFPAGIYQLDGALQNTSTHNSQLVIPIAASRKAIRFLGAEPISVYGEALSVPTPYSILRSSWDGTISGSPAIISAGGYHGSGGYSLLYAVFENLIIVAHDNPKLDALQMTAAASTRIVNVQIRTTSANPAAVPTHTNACGLEGPWSNASTVADYALGLDIYGFFVGIVPAEQFTGLDVAIAFCARAMLFIGGGSTHYPVVMQKLVFNACKRGLVFETDLRWVQMSMMAVEHASGTFSPIYDIDDASNYARGFIEYHGNDYTGGPEDIIVNGAAGLSYHWGEGKYWKLNSVVELPAGTDPSTNPATGGKLYAASATGHPTWRDSSGAVSDLLAAALTIKDEGSSLATAATSLDFTGAGVTASGTGAAKTIAIPGGGGEILVADVPAGSPLVFADLLQNEAQDDMLYSD